MHEARHVEEPALHLAAAAVGDQQLRPSEQLDEAEEVEPLDPAEARDAEAAGEAELVDRGHGDRMVDEQELHLPGVARERRERRVEGCPVAEQLVAVDADDPVRPVDPVEPELNRRRERDGVADRVAARVDHGPAVEVRRGRRTRRVVDLREPGDRAPVQLLRERVEEVEGANARLDVRDRHAQRAAHQRAEDGRHRVAVDEHERPLSEAAAQPAPLPRERPSDAGEPAGNVGVPHQVAPARAAAEPEVGLWKTEQVEERRDLLDLLAGRRVEVVDASSAQPGQHRRELDQLARRPVDHADHRRNRPPAASASPRHIPAPWASA